jgi:hypothetical protein
MESGIGDMQGSYAEHSVAADGAGMTAFRDLKFPQPAPLLNLVFDGPGKCDHSRRR